MANITVDIDVMINGGDRFYRSLKYSYCPLFKFDFDAMASWLFGKLPSLKTRDDAVLWLKFPNGREVQCTIKDKEL